MKKAFVILTLSFIILISQFFGIGLHLQNVQAADLTGTASIDAFVENLVLTQISPNDTQPLGNDVPKNGDFRMTYSFRIPQNSGMLDEDFFYLDLPSYVHVPVNVMDVAIIDSSYNYHVLDVSMMQGAGTGGLDAIRVDFTSDLEAQTSNYEFTGEFWFEASFDETEVGTGGPITIDFDSGRVSDPISILVDFEADPPPQANFSKTNNYSSSNPNALFDATDHRHYITWTLDINSNNVDMGDNIVIEDVIDTTWMEIWPDMTDPLNPVYVNQTVGSAAYTENYDSATNTLTITFTEAVTDQQVFTYQTAVLTSAYIDRLSSNNTTLNITNDAEIIFPNSEIIESNDSSISYDLDVINKSLDESVVTGGIDYTNRLIYWQIDVNPNNYIIDGAYVTDSIPSDFTMIDSSIRYEFLTSGTVYTSGSFDATVNYSNVGQDYQFNLGDISEPITITFTTEYSDDIYYTQTNESYTNTAYFHPPGTNISSTSDNQGVGFNTEVITKTSTGSDYNNVEPAYIDWELVINPNASSTAVSLTDIYVVDTIPTGLILYDPTNDGDYSDAFTLNRSITGEVADASISYNVATNEIIIDFDTDNTRSLSDTEISDYNAANDPDIGRDTISERYEISFRTIVAPGYEYYYKQNDNTTFTNRAEYESYNAGTGTETASRTLYPQILIKDFMDYDYNTHYITWRFRVNRDDNDIYNPDFIDYIPEGLKYVDGTFRLFEGSTPVALDAFGGYMTYTEHDPVEQNPRNTSQNISGTIEYTFFPRIGDPGYSAANFITNDYYIYFETEFVDLDILSENHLGDGVTSDVDVSNVAYLLHDQDHPTIIIQDNETDSFTSSVIEKSSNYSTGNQFIDWVVTINKNQIDIYGPNPDPYPANSYIGPVIYDTLQEGLVLDLESIVLYNATVASDGTVTHDPADIVPFNIDQVTYDANTRDLTFEFPNTISTCYQMTFTTYISSGYSGPFTNTASFHALTGEPDDESDEQDVLFATGGGYAAANIGHLVLTKIDEESLVPLQGATFELIDANGTVVDVQETDAAGHATFEFVFFNRDYWYRESIPPYGYSGDTTTTTYFTIDGNEATNEGDNDPDRTYAPDAITNSANPVTVQFMKYAEDGTTGLQGASFAIYDTNDPAAIVAIATSDATGLVTFSDLPANRSYNISELAPPLGYLLDTTVLTVAVTVGDVPFVPTPSSITNVRDSSALSSIVFTKYAEDSTTPLAGCVFGVYPAAFPTLLLATATSQADGSVEFLNVPAGDYVIREISTVSGYALSTDELTVTVDTATGAYVTTPDSMTNYLDGSVEVQVHSTFSLSGMSFRVGLYSYPSGAFVRQLNYVNGSLTNFTNLPFGSYSARIMPNDYGLVGTSQNDTITISETHGHVDIYLARNPQTGDRTAPIRYTLAGIIIVCWMIFAGLYIRRYYKNKSVC